MPQYSVELAGKTIPYLGKHVQYNVNDDEKQRQQCLNLRIAEKEDWNNNDRDFSRHHDQLPVIPAGISALAVLFLDQVTLSSEAQQKFKAWLTRC